MEKGEGQSSETTSSRIRTHVVASNTHFAAVLSGSLLCDATVEDSETPPGENKERELLYDATVEESCAVSYAKIGGCI